MQTYKLNSVGKFGPGDVLTLTKDQIAPRKHAVEIMEEKGAGAVVKATAALEFKAGEVLGMPHLPKYISAEMVGSPTMEAAPLPGYEASKPAPRRGGRTVSDASLV